MRKEEKAETAVVLPWAWRRGREGVGGKVQSSGDSRPGSCGSQAGPRTLSVVVEEKPGRRLCFSHRTFILNQFLRLSVSSVFPNTTVQDRPITVQDRKTQRKYASSLAPTDVGVGRKFHSGSGLNRSFWCASNSSNTNTLVSMPFLFLYTGNPRHFFTHWLIHKFVFLECK